jgi:hypothetical protein
MRAFQHDIDIIHVEAPSSITVRNIFIPIDYHFDMEINLMGEPMMNLIKSKVIKIDYEGSTPPMEDNKDFCCIGKLWWISSVDMEHGAYAKYSTIL